MNETQGGRTTVSFPGADGLRIIADVQGNPAAPPIVLLHGGGQTRHSWKRSLPVLASDGYRVYALDARGHGDSDWAADGDYRYDAFARDLYAVLAEIAGTPILIGASLGGLTSLVCLAAPHPPPARALILVDVAPRIDMRGVDRILRFMESRPEGFATLEEAAAETARHNPHRPPPSSNAGLLQNLREREGRLHWHWDPAFLYQRRTDREAITASLEAAAGRIRVPTMLIHAGQSDVVGEPEIRRLQEILPGSLTVTLPGTGHMVAGDDNAAFNQAIRHFLADLLPAAG